MAVYEYGYLTLASVKDSKAHSGSPHYIMSLAILTTESAVVLLPVDTGRLAAMNSIGREGWIIGERERYAPTREDKFRLHWINKLLDQHGMTDLALYHVEAFDDYHVRREL